MGGESSASGNKSFHVESSCRFHDLTDKAATIEVIFQAWLHLKNNEGSIQSSTKYFVRGLGDVCAYLCVQT